MGCETWREAISARLDGEAPVVDDALLDAHLRRCAACRDYLAAASMPDMSARVSRRVAEDDRASRPAVRVLLAVVAIEIIALSVPALVLGEGAGATDHGARHLGTFTIAYGVGLLVVAARPARARTMLPVAAVLAVALLITAAVDLAGGRIPLVGEARHVPEILSVVLVWLLTTPRPDWFVRSRSRAWSTPTPRRSR